MEFFLTGVAETAEQAIGTARELMTIFEDHRQKIAGVGRATPSALRVHELMQAHPIVTIQTVSERLGISFATAGAALEKLTDIGVALLAETTCIAQACRQAMWLNRESEVPHMCARLGKQ
jgi:Fic family protein